MFFNNSPVARFNFLKHLGGYLDSSLDLTHHVKQKLQKL